MSSHRAERPSRLRLTRRTRPTKGPRIQWFGQGRTRALLATGIMFGLGATGTYAYWTDQGTVTAGTISSGTLDLTAGPSTGLENLTGTGPNNWDYTAFNISEMIPGESISKTVVVGNNGSAPLRFNATVKSTNNNLTSGTDGLQITIHDNSTANTQTGTQAAGNRTGTCSGSVSLTDYVDTSASGNAFGTDISLPSNGNTRSLCVRALLMTSAPNSLMNKSTSIVITLSATQLGAP
jgi:alternate signal-mediated exported protein